MSSSKLDKLAEFRAKKREALEKEARQKQLWDLVTFAPLRRRWSESKVRSEQEEVVQDEDEEEDLDEEQERTSIDWLILAVKILLWSLCFYLAVLLEFGLVYLVTSAFALFYLGTGKRRKGTPSAYSVFNPNCESIDGTLKAEDFEREIRYLRSNDVIKLLMKLL